MNIEEAKSAIGQQFKIDLTDVRGGAVNMFDTIRRVTYEGNIVGDFIETHCENARLKSEQPLQFQKHSG